MLAIILGSGLSSFSNQFSIKKRIPFSEVLDISFDALSGHERCFYIASYGDTDFIIVSGKLHYYEGLTEEEINLPLQYILSNYKISTWVITSASGGLSRRMEPGQWTHLNSILCLPFPKLRNATTQPIPFLGLNELTKAVYAYQQGPSLGTAAEYRMLRKIGADLVGMSMYPEKLFLDRNDQRSVFLSVPVCNYFTESSKEIQEPSHAEVIRIAQSAVPELVRIFQKLLKEEI